MALRRAIFWIHLCVGVGIGVVVMTMSVTGVLLTYELQLNRWALHDYRSVDIEGDSPLSIDSLIRLVETYDADTLASVTIRADYREPAMFRFSDRAVVYIDRYTGQVLGAGDGVVRRTLRSVMYWHRWLALEGEGRKVGRAVTGAANLGFFFLVISGVYLWWPRVWTKNALSKVTWFSSGLEGRARNFNWHNVIGLWVAIPLLLIIFSGASISYGWVRDLVYFAVGESSSVEAAKKLSESSDRFQTPEEMERELSYETLVLGVSAEVPEWTSMRLELPDAHEPMITVSFDRGNGRQPEKRVEFYVDRRTGEIVDRGGYETFSRGLKIRRWLRFVHTGEVYGVIGQTVAGVASLGASVLVWTGLSLSWHRFWRPKKPRLWSVFFDK